MASVSHPFALVPMSKMKSLPYVSVVPEVGSKIPNPIVGVPDPPKFADPYINQ